MDEASCLIRPVLVMHCRNNASKREQMRGMQGREMRHGSEMAHGARMDGGRFGALLGLAEESIMGSKDAQQLK